MALSAAAAFAAVANSVRSNPMGCSSVDVPGEMGTRLINLCMRGSMSRSESISACVNSIRGCPNTAQSLSHWFFMRARNFWRGFIRRFFLALIPFLSH